MNWIIAIIVVVIIVFLLDREIYFYEGVHLGPRVQAWLYDRWSRKYDEGKRASQLHDEAMLAEPLLEALKDIPEPFLLDFATGTGRLSSALLSQPRFKGHIIALDLSQGMLEQAASKLNGLDLNEQSARSARPTESSNRMVVELLRHLTLPLPFPDAVFDAVCALEVLELFPNMDEPLAELVRVLRPGGILLTSRGTEESGRKAKVKSRNELAGLLEKNGLQNIHIAKWWKLFDRVLAVKDGPSSPAPGRQLSEVFLCAQCKQIRWQTEANRLRCLNCGHALEITKERIVLN